MKGLLIFLILMILLLLLLSPLPVHQCGPGLTAIELGHHWIRQWVGIGLCNTQPAAPNRAANFHLEDPQSTWAAALRGDSSSVFVACYLPPQLRGQISRAMESMPLDRRLWTRTSCTAAYRKPRVPRSGSDSCSDSDRPTDFKDLTEDISEFWPERLEERSRGKSPGPSSPTSLASHHPRS